VREFAWSVEGGDCRERVKVKEAEFEVEGIEMSDQGRSGLRWRTWMGLDASCGDPTENGSPL